MRPIPALLLLITTSSEDDWGGTTGVGQNPATVGMKRRKNKERNINDEKGDEASLLVEHANDDGADSVGLKAEAVYFFD